MTIRPIRIHIAGGPGSGKSVAAALISKSYGVPVTHLDDLFWDNAKGRYGIRASRERRDSDLAAVLDTPRWITEGVYHTWIRRCLGEAEVVIILTTPVWLRDWRIVTRFARRRLGQEPSKRESVLDLVRLLRWNHGYDAAVLAPLRATLRDLGSHVFECRTGSEALAAVQCHLTRG